MDRVKRWLRHKLARKLVLEYSGPRQHTSTVVFKNKLKREVWVNMQYGVGPVYVAPGDTLQITAQGDARGYVYGVDLEELAEQAHDATLLYAVTECEKAGLTRV